MGTAKRWRQWTAEQARSELEQWAASGLSLAAFARQRGYSTQRLRWWRERMAQWRGVPKAAASLVPVTLTLPAASGAITLELPGGVRLEAPDAAALPVEWLASLVRELAR